MARVQLLFLLKDGSAQLSFRFVVALRNTRHPTPCTSAARSSRPCRRRSPSPRRANICAFAGVTATLCAQPCVSVPICAFIPKYHVVPFFVNFISRSRCFASFFVDDGAEMRVASRIAPPSRAEHPSPIYPTQLKQPPRQPVPLQYMEKLAEGRLVRRLANVHTGKNALRQVVVLRILHGQIRIPIPLLQKINAQYRIQPRRRTPLSSLVVKRPNQIQHCSPRKNRVHLGQKALLRSLLGTIPVTRILK